MATPEKKKVKEYSKEVEKAKELDVNCVICPHCSTANFIPKILNNSNEDIYCCNCCELLM